MWSLIALAACTTRPADLTLPDSGVDTGTDSAPPPEDTAPFERPGWLLINEFQASNATTELDEDGLYCDWIELYNGGDAALDLAGFTITDDLTEPDKHTIGVLSISAGGYLVLFADGEPDLGARHLDFALDADGEELGLYDPEGEALTRLVYEEHATDWAAARLPDGSADWAVTDQPTPGAANLGATE